MARIVAVDWDRRELRCVVASATGGRLRIASARAVPLVDVAEGGQSRADVGGSLRAAVGDTRWGRSTLLVGINRARVEVLQFALPPAKDAELPGLVAMQVLRESPTAEEDSIVDFVVSSEPDGEVASGPAARPRQVTAAVLQPDVLERIQAICQEAGLKPQRLLLRPFAAASLFARRLSPAERTCLLVNLVGDEADLLVLVDSRLVFQRTVRLPDQVGEEVVAQRLTAEINRTLVVAQQGPLATAPVERVFVYGGAEEHQALVDAIQGELSLPVTVVDPFEITDVPDEGLPGQPGRFAALLGMILDESYGSHALDFLHPKRPPRPVDRRRLLIAAASLAVAACLAVGYYVWDEMGRIDNEINLLADELRQKADLLKRTASQRQLVQALRDWTASEVIWLDELRDLSIRLPPGRDLMVLRMAMVSERSGGGNIELTGLVRDPLVVPRMEQALRDDYHEIRSRRVQEREPGPRHSWLFESSLSVWGRDKASYLEKQVAAQ